MTAFVDANILIRHLTGDPPDQAERATRYLRAARTASLPSPRAPGASLTLAVPIAPPGVVVRHRAQALRLTRPEMPLRTKTDHPVLPAGLSS